AAPSRARRQRWAAGRQVGQPGAAAPPGTRPAGRPARSPAAGIAARAPEIAPTSVLDQCKDRVVPQLLAAVEKPQLDHEGDLLDLAAGHLDQLARGRDGTTRGQQVVDDHYA